MIRLILAATFAAVLMTAASATAATAPVKTAATTIPACFKSEGLEFQTTMPGGGWTKLANAGTGPSIQLTGNNTVGYAVYFNAPVRGALLVLVGTNVADNDQLLGPNYLLPGSGANAAEDGYGIAWSMIGSGTAHPTVAQKAMIAKCVSGRTDAAA